MCIKLWTGINFRDYGDEFRMYGTWRTSRMSLNCSISLRKIVWCNFTFRECLLAFGAEYFVFQFAIQNLKIKIYRTIILRVVLYGCETRSLTLREEPRLRLFESRVLRRVFGPKRDEVTGSEENYIMRSLMICIPHPILFGWSNREEWDGMDM